MSYSFAAIGHNFATFGDVGNVATGPIPAGSRVTAVVVTISTPTLSPITIAPVITSEPGLADTAIQNGRALVQRSPNRVLGKAAVIHNIGANLPASLVFPCDIQVGPEPAFAAARIENNGAGGIAQITLAVIAIAPGGPIALPGPQIQGLPGTPPFAAPTPPTPFITGIAP